MGNAEGGIDMNKKATIACLVGALMLGALSLGCQENINYLKARSELNQGVNAFGRSDYAFAAVHFEKAFELDPDLLTAQQYLATSYMMQYIPGGESDDNLAIAVKALDVFEDVLNKNPENASALAYVGSLYFNMEKMDEAKETYTRLIAADPSDKQARYTMGVIAWTEAYQPRLDARATYYMKQEEPGPLKVWCDTNRRLSRKDRAACNEAREGLLEAGLPIVEGGMRHLEKAIELDPDYGDAMAYLNLLYRERADLAETKEEHDADTAQADDWVQKTLDAKKRVAEAGTQDLFQEGE
jgi:tetratricopeptide (TPR) repeat protein